jgi:hypothetical protein
VHEGRDGIARHATVVAVGYPQAEHVLIEGEHGREVDGLQYDVAQTHDMGGPHCYPVGGADTATLVSGIELQCRTHRAWADHITAEQQVQAPAIGVVKRHDGTRTEFFIGAHRHIELRRYTVQIVQAGYPVADTQGLVRPAFGDVGRITSAVAGHLQRGCGLLLFEQAKITEETGLRIKVGNLIAHVGDVTYGNHVVLLLLLFNPWIVKKRARLTTTAPAAAQDSRIFQLAQIEPAGGRIEGVQLLVGAGEKQQRTPV